MNPKLPFPYKFKISSSLIIKRRWCLSWTTFALLCWFRFLVFKNYFFNQMIFNQRIWDIDNIFKTLLLIFMKYSISNGGTWCAYLVLIVCRGFLYLWISTDCMFKWLHCTVPKPENTNDAECHWNLNHCKDCRLLRYIVLGLPHNCLHFAAQFEHKLDSNSGHVIRVTS